MASSRPGADCRCVATGWSPTGATPGCSRGRWRAVADILSSGADLAHPGPILLFALEGAADVNGHALAEGDAAIATDNVTADTEGFLYAARLFAL